MKRKFPISELSARTGVPRATIHHYVSHGLLPDPERAAANRFLYDERHVRGLRLIRILRDRRGLDLASIKKVLPDLMNLNEDQAFKPEVWDRAAGLRLAEESHDSAAGRLLDVAVDAFSRDNYGEINVDELCTRSSVSKGSFYRHFGSKEELFFAAAEAAADEVACDFATRVARSKKGFDPVDELVLSFDARLPLLLQLMTRSLQHLPGYRRAARRILGSLSDRVTTALAESGSPAPGDNIICDAVARAAGAVMSDGGDVPGLSALA